MKKEIHNLNKFVSYRIHITSFKIANYCNITKLDVKNNSKRKYLYFTTKSLQEFNMLHSLFYSQGKKSSKLIEKLLTPIGLAYWIMVLK
jgi:LAGLIDADG DNA endonuclease family